MRKRKIGGSGGGSTSKYPWDQWFRGDHTILVWGVDYYCSQSSMVQTIRNKASSLGLRLEFQSAGVTEIKFTVVGRRDDAIRDTEAETPFPPEPPIGKLAEAHGD